MRMSELFRKGILKTTVGGIFNKIKIHSRRDTLFFEEIGSEYIKECEMSGYSEEMKNIGRDWMGLYFKYLLPSALKSIPPKFFLNVIVKKIWINIGMMDYFSIKERNGFFEILTRNEGLTRFIGRNSLMAGFYAGILGSLFGSEFRLVEAVQTKKTSTYLFEKTGDSFEIKGKEKHVYDRLNRMESREGLTLKNAFRKNLFELKNNRIYFRGRSISPVENTLFHLIGNRGLMMGKVAEMSNRFFKDVISKESPDTKKIILLKNLLQVMGWGIINVEFRNREIVLEIKYPAYGLQLEGDNWDFLVNTILGYVWLIDEKFRISEVKQIYRKLRITYRR